jgi:Zn-dependent peptidase ImmA (M78 family)/transcriptional regulator with XRE-family HTH domain
MQEKLFEIRHVPVNGDRVRLARELAGLTQAALCEALGVDQTMVAHIERGKKQPSEELLAAISAELRQPTSFFRQGSPPDFPRGSLLFRSKSGIGKRTIAQIHSHAELVFEFISRLSQQASLVPVRLPKETDPIEAARQVRKELGLSSGPLTSMIRAVERLGVITIPLPDHKDCEAFAVWAGPDRACPVLGLVVNKASDRVRMSVAHELGHLILHRNILGGTQELESQAYRFAAELLMPTHDIKQEFDSERLSLFRLAALKRKWQVSMQALARRARDLEAISDRQYRYIMQQMSLKGWRTEEPRFGQQVIEMPRVITKLTEVTVGSNPNLQKLSVDFNLSKDFLTSVLKMCSAQETRYPAREKVRSAEVIGFAARK